MTDKITQALAEIKSDVEAKFGDVATKSDVEGKANSVDLVALKENLEKIEAKLDAIPAQVRSVETKAFGSVNEAFEYSIKNGGKATAEIEIKGITQGRDVTGGVTSVLGLNGSSFAANPFRALASVIVLGSKAMDIPTRSGSHGAANAGATKDVTDNGNAAVGVNTLVVQTYNAQNSVTTEAVEDIPGFDEFWTQDMLDEVASKEALAHVTLVEAIAGDNAGSATALDLDDFGTLIFDTAPQYRANGSLVISSGAMAQLRTLNTSGTGSDLVFDAQIGTFRLFGFPVYENGYMAAVATGEVVAAFGDFKKGLIVANRSAAAVSRFDQTVPGKYTYYAELRAGAAPWVTGAVRTLTMA